MLGCSVLILGFILLFAVLTLSRRLSFPQTYALEPVPLTGLTNSEIATLGKWNRDLEERGFRRAGEFVVRINHAPSGSCEQIEQFRGWLSADGRTWACGKHESFFDHSSTGAVRSILSLTFLSQSADGITSCTHNKNLDEGYERHPKNRVLHRPDLSEVGPMLSAHELHAPEATDRRTWEVGAFAAVIREDWEEKGRWLEANKYLRSEGDRYRATPKLALTIALYSLNPLRIENGNRWAVLLKLLTCAVLMGVFQVLVRRQAPPQQLEIELYGLNLLWGILGSILFPRLSFVSWFYVVLPPYLYLHFREGYDGESWLYGFLITALICTGVERLRYARAGKRLDASAPREPALAGTARVMFIGGLLLSGAVSIGAHLVVRTPMPTTWGPLLMRAGLLLLSIGFVLIFGYWTLLSMFPERRKSPSYPIIRALGWCGLVILVGLGTGLYFDDADQTASTERARTIQSALENYRKELDVYPETLQELLPKYLPAVPIPRAGLSDLRFEYRKASEGGNPGYRLSYVSSSGERIFFPRERSE